MKMTLAEFDAFQKTIPDGWYFEGDDEFIDDDFWDGKYDPEKIININKGDIYILLDSIELPKDGIDEKDFLTEFKKWKSSIDYEFVVIKIPKGKKDELIFMVKEKFGDV
jgi:hypothetical protein